MTSTSSFIPKRANPLAYRGLRLLWIGESISVLGDQFYLVALPWLVLQLTNSALAVGTILAASGIPRALFMLLGGVLTDRLSPRMLMLLSNAARVGIAGLLTLLVATGGIRLWMLYVFSVSFGIVDAFFHPAYLALVPVIVDDDALEASNAVLQGTSFLLSAVGPGLGGVLVQLAGIAIALFLDTLSFAAATATLWMMKTTGAARSASAGQAGVTAEIRDAVRYIFGDGVLRPMLIIATALNVAFIAPMMVGPAMLAKTRFAEGSVAFGVLLSALGIGSVVGMLAGGVLKPSRLGISVLATVIVAGLCMVGVGFASALWLAALLLAITGISSGFSNLLLLTWLQRHVSRDMMGRVMSVMMLFSIGLMPIASAVGGIIAEYSVPLLFAVCGLLVALIAAVSLFNQRIRALRA